MAEVEKKTENLVYAKPKLITDNVMHYCPGCSHGTVHKLIAEVIEEMGFAEKTVGVSPVGCSVFAYNYIDIDWIEAAHGRAQAVATARPQKIITYRKQDGTELFITPVDVDSLSGEKMMSVAIDEVVISASNRRNLVERNGKINVEFVVSVPLVLQARNW